MTDAIFDNFTAIFFGVLVLIGLIFISVIVVAVRNARAARRHGLDPTTMQTELAARIITSEPLRGARTVEQRLSALDSLRDSGTITAEEHRAARAKILGDL